MTDASRSCASLEELVRARQAHTPPDLPLLIGIGGGTAAGKSTLARDLAVRLAPLAVQLIGQDRFFKPTSELPTAPSSSRQCPWPDYNRPDSFRVEELLQHCRGLSGADVVLLEGILVLHYAELRRLMALRLYVEADADERITRRMRRNVRAGMNLDDVADYYLESVRFQHERYNAPTRLHADLIVPGGAAEAHTRDALSWAICTAVARAHARIRSDGPQGEAGADRSLPA